MDPGAAAAIKSATEAVRAAPNDLAVWQRLAAVHLAHGRFLDAKTCYDYLTSALPTNAQMHYFSALAADKLGDENARRAAIDRAIAHASSSSVPRWRGSLWAMEAGDLDRAEALVAQAGTSPSALKVRALIHLAKGKATAARTELTAAMHADPSDRYAPYLLGRALQAAGERAEAAKTLLLAGETEPWFDDPWAEEIAAHRADLAMHVEGVKELMTGNDLDAALLRIEQLLAVYGPRRNLSLMRVNILMRQNNRQLGVAVTKQLLTDYPEWAPAHLRMATILRGTRNLANIKLAMGYAHTAAALAPGSAEAWFTLASLAASLREYDTAQDAFRRCIAIVPNQPAYRGGLIDMLIAAGELDAAADAIETQESLFGLSLETKLLRVRWLHASGRNTEAHTLFAECRRAAPGHPALEGIGRLIGGTP